jgi:hypothetical protein
MFSLACGSSGADSAPNDLVDASTPIATEETDGGNTIKPDDQDTDPRPTDEPDEQPVGPMAVINADGVLTDTPNVRFTDVGVDGIAVVSSSMRVIEDGDERGGLLRWVGEIENTSNKLACRMLATVQFGAQELITVVDAPAYYDEYSGVTASCLRPGERGVFYGVERGFSPEDLEREISLRYDFESNVFGTYQRALDEPIVASEEMVERVDGYALEGELRLVSNLYNYSMNVYPRDARGLLVARLGAFPGDLEDLVAGQTLAFSTDATDAKFVGTVIYHSWISRDKSRTKLRAVDHERALVDARIRELDATR